MNLDLSFYWHLFVRRVPVMMIFVLLCSGLGGITAFKLPDVWATSALLLVEEQQIPQNMVNSAVQTAAEEQLDIVQRKLLTRANLLDIANKFDVFDNIRSMEPDTVVERMRESTHISRSAGRNRATVMTLRFEGGSPQIAANVVNEYVTLVLEDNTQFRLDRAENTLDFFEQEVERLSQDLDQQSSLISTFKSDNSDALPEEQSYRLNRQVLLQERLSRLEQEANSIRAQRTEMTRIFNTTGQVQNERNNLQRLTPEQQQLIVEKAELEHIKSTYSETNPRVIRQQSVVDRLEAVSEAQQAQQVGAEDGVSAEKALLDATLVQLETRLQFLEDDFEKTQVEVETLQSAITRSSSVGIQLAALERDYLNIQTRYNTALRNLDAARMSVRVETSAQGQRITVIENANVPQVPAGPRRSMIAAMGIMVGIGLAAAYFVLLELLNRTVRTPRELIDRFNVTPIATIPYIESRMRKIVRRSGIVLATLFVVTGVPLSLWFIDTNYMPLELVVQRSLASLGLG